MTILDEETKCIVKKAIADFDVEGKLSAYEVSAFGIMYGKDSKFVYGRQACHGSLSVWNGPDTPPTFILSRIQTARADSIEKEPEALVYVNWLVNFSPYSSVFLVKSAEEILSSGFFVVDCDAPSEVMVAGLVAARRIHELTNIALTTAKLIGAGVNGNLAYLLSHLIGVSGGENYFWACQGCEHTTVHKKYMSRGMVKNFIQNDLQEENISPYSAIRTYSGTYKTMFGSSIDPYLWEFCTSFNLSDGVACSYTSPFSASNNTPVGKPEFDFNSLLSSAKYLELELMKECGVDESFYSKPERIVRSNVA